MSLRVLYNIVLLMSLLGILKASCPRAPPKKGRVILNSNCTASKLDIEILKHLEDTITTRVVPAVFTVVFFLGLPANSIALWVLIFKTKKMPSTMLLINLAAADLLFLLALPFKITYHFMENNWIFGETLCRIVTAVFYGNMYGSVLFLMAISIDRYIGLVHPFSAKGLRDWRYCTYASIGLWLVAIAAVSAFTFVPQTKHFNYPDRTTCHDIWANCTGYNWYTLYFLGLVIIGFFIPSVVILFCYVLILVTLAKKKESYRRVIGLISLVLIIFILCFTPSNILLVLHYLETEWDCHNQLYFWYVVALSLTSLNSCIDPFIYCYASSDFWTTVKDTLCISREGNSVSSEGTKRSKLTLSSDKEMLRSGA
ncbi:proteinase-activated receptor 3-like [Bufo gargarizans]|uniref:proteinase-activated receptor 3-like n=1 Tax=Bufo gargarizans TaxID=30331 RepID=UPI001CF3C7C7|nr:proteinase-activated receptor 3-like [Bufo gargarizans]